MRDVPEQMRYGILCIKHPVRAVTVRQTTLVRSIGPTGRPNQE